MNVRILPLLIVLTVACGTARTNRPESIAQPMIDVALTAPIFFGSSGSAPATIGVDIENRANVPINVRRIEVDSPGMVQYSLARRNQTFRETIAPGASRSLTILATAIRNARNPAEPLTIRAIVELEAGGKVWREMMLVRQ